MKNCFFSSLLLCSSRAAALNHAQPAAQNGCQWRGAVLLFTPEKHKNLFLSSRTESNLKITAPRLAPLRPGSCRCRWRGAGERKFSSRAGLPYISLFPLGEVVFLSLSTKFSFLRCTTLFCRIVCFPQHYYSRPTVTLRDILCLTVFPVVSSPCPVIFIFFPLDSLFCLLIAFSPLAFPFCYFPSFLGSVLRSPVPVSCLPASRAVRISLLCNRRLFVQNLSFCSSFSLSILPGTRLTVLRCHFLLYGSSRRRGPCYYGVFHTHFCVILISRREKKF